MAENGTNMEDLVPKKNFTSVIQIWFGFSPDGDTQTTVTCKVHTDRVCTLDANTTNPFHHVKRENILNNLLRVKQVGTLDPNEPHRHVTQAVHMMN